MGWFAPGTCGCCYDPPPCGFCSADNDTITLTIGGFSGMSVCGCARVFNGVWTLPREYANACYYLQTYTYTCVPGGAPRYVNMEAWVTGDGTHLCWFAQLYFQGVFYNYKWDSGSMSAFDCTATRTLTFTSISGSFGATPCTGYASTTCQIN